MRIRIQQLKLMRIYPDPEPWLCLLYTSEISIYYSTDIFFEAFFGGWGGGGGVKENNFEAMKCQQYV